ncbi:hypothetical protein ACTDI4_18020 [Mesorhizobium sp. PUT5]|uniref:hypothetical protein n=1 Tax=Mesorhizobium sp. PUT5 TaxID=3454629 RepID=UPI003FA40D97
MAKSAKLDVLLAHARAHCDREGIRLSTLSTRLFNDGKVLARIERGADMTLRRYSRAMTMLSEPPGVVDNFRPLLGTSAGGIARDLQQR